jgi:hypothetical protein
MTRISVAIWFALFIMSMKEPCEANPFTMLKKYYDIAVEIYDGIDKINNAISEDASSKIDALKQDVSYRLDNINKNIEKMKDTILATITNKLKDKISVKMDTLFDQIKDIESSFRVFYKLFTKQKVMGKEELKRFAEESTSYSKIGLRRTVELMHEAFVDSDYSKNESVISIIAKDSKAADTICIKGLSSQQLIYDLYKVIAKADSKALIVKLYAYDVLKESEKDNTYDTVKEETKQEHLALLKATFENVKHFMHIASREVWRCDPQKLQKGINYEKLPDVFQGYFINKGDLTVINKIHQAFGVFTTSINMGSYKCHDIKDERLRCKSAVCKAQPPNKVCTGHIRDCSFISDNVQVCHAPSYDDRRYVWAHLIGTSEYYGDHSRYCPDTQGLLGITSEQICYCMCESEKQEELRYFSLHESTSDVDQNKVVTGVQFVTENHVFHIRIQQGVLSKEGTIVGKPEWKEIKHITKNELVSRKVSKHILKTISDIGEPYRYEEWTEFYKNDLVYTVHYKQKTIFLDDFDFPDGSKLVTGLRFRQVDDALRLEVKMTPFDYATGKLNADAPDQWKFNPKKKNDR